MRTIRVVIGDDDRAFREAASDVLEADPRFTVVEAVATGAELRELAARTRPDVALVDVRMPEGGPPAVRALLADDLAAATAEDHTALVVVAVSAHTGVFQVRAMLSAGASGYLAKGRIGGALPDLVHRCVAGEVVLAVPTGARVLDQLQAPTETPPEPIGGPADGA